MISNRDMPSYQRIIPRTSQKAIETEKQSKVEVSKEVQKEIPRESPKEVSKETSNKMLREYSKVSQKELLKSKSCKSARAACILDSELIPAVGELEHKVGYCFCHYCTCNLHKCCNSKSQKSMKFPLTSYNKDFTGKSSKKLNQSVNYAPQIYEYHRPPCKFLQFETTNRVHYVPYKSEPVLPQKKALLYKPMKQVYDTHYHRQFRPWDSSPDKPFRIPDHPCRGNMLNFNANSTYDRFFNQTNPSVKVDIRDGNVKNLKLFSKSHVAEFDSVAHTTHTDQFDRHLQVNLKIPSSTQTDFHPKGVNETTNYMKEFQGKGQILLLKRRAKY